jgi:hypothetical protein
MGNNYNFKFNPELPSKEEINQRKDFAGLLRRFQEEQSLKRGRIRRLRRIYITSAAAAAIALLFLVGNILSPDDPTITAEAYFAQQEYIHPPFPAVKEAKLNKIKVNASQGGVYEYSSGSRLVIPAVAFADDYGNMIEGEVDIYFREMHDHVDLFIGGIPMRYDSAGNIYQLESAGLIELYAEQNGQQVQLVSGKSIDVELVSEIYLSNLEDQVIPPFEVYFLDTFNRNWIYQSANQLKLLEEEILDENDPLYQYKKDLFTRLEDIDARSTIELSALEDQFPKPVAPLRPQAADPDQPTLELNFLDGSIAVEENGGNNIQSELAKLQQTYSGMIWQISPKSPAYDERAFGVEWESVHLRPKDDSNYELTLIHPQNQVTLIVSPVLTGSDYQEAFSLYREELNAYEQALQEREQQLQGRREALERSIAAQKAAVTDAYQSQLDALSNSGVHFSKGEEYLVKRKVINSFTVNHLGIWNCARPIMMQGEVINADFRTPFGEKYREHTAYITQKGRNTIHQFYANGASPITLNPDASYLIWIVTEDQKVALVQPNSTDWQSDKDGDYTFRMDVKDQVVQSEEELRQLLSF